MDKTVRVWEISKGHCIRVIYGISSQLCIRFHPVRTQSISPFFHCQFVEIFAEFFFLVAIFLCPYYWKLAADIGLFSNFQLLRFYAVSRTQLAIYQEYSNKKKFFILNLFGWLYEIFFPHSPPLTLICLLHQRLVYLFYFFPNHIHFGLALVFVTPSMNNHYPVTLKGHTYFFRCMCRTISIYSLIASNSTHL